MKLLKLRLVHSEPEGESCSVLYLAVVWFKECGMVCHLKTESDLLHFNHKKYCLFLRDRGGRFLG